MLRQWRNLYYPFCWRQGDEQDDLMQAKDSPWLAFPNGNTYSLMSFQSVSSNRLYHRKLPGAIGSKKICGSSVGFLIMVDQTSAQITIINPLTSARFELPPISTSMEPQDNTQKYSVHKAVLSSVPDCESQDYALMAIYGKKRQLAYYEAKSRTWKKLQEAGLYYDDVIFHKRGFYAVDEYGKVVIYRPRNLQVVKEIAARWFFRGKKVYLVGMKDSLLVVIRFLDDEPTLGYQTYKFEVHLLKPFEQWTHLGSIEGVALFLGQNESVALPVKDFDGLKDNCLYFTDDNSEAYKYQVICGHDMGVFDMEEKDLQPLKRSEATEAIWLTPEKRPFA